MVTSTLVAVLLAQAGAASTSEEVPVGIFRTIRPHSGADIALGGTKGFGHHGGGGGGGSSGIPGIDSLTNWTGQFTAPGFDGAGNPQSVWPFAMVGRSPDRGGPTVINAPVIPVVVDLLDVNGKVAVRHGTTLTIDPTSIVKPVLKSPVFQPWPFNSGFTQFNDAMFRAEFWNRIDTNWGDNGWHTLLNPSLKKTYRMQIPYGSWFYALNTDGSVIALVDATTFSNLLFPPTYPVDNSTVIGAAELAGDMTTRDLTSFLFKDVYLYDGTISNCCILGFHAYDYEPGVPSNGNLPRLYVMDYASWISPGLFSGGFEDITALSHEINETYNDPFINNATPWWLNFDPFYGYAICQNNLETGDVIEVLSALATFPIQMNGRTYHPQNVAMFPWFAFQSPSPALWGAYSFPDETVLPGLSPPNLPPGCGF